MENHFALLDKKVDAFFNKVLNSKTPNKIAVAVSGGPDSMALCLLLNTWAKKSNQTIVALTVDHQLREDSSKEAKTVRNWLKNRNIEHHTLIWDHNPILTGIQKKAREARYKLLTDFCLQHSIKFLCTAHHEADQLETFLMRLSKGSGLEGLSVIKEFSSWNNITIARPLLSIQPEILKKYLQAVSQEYINDPSNDDLRFERVQWRTLLHTMNEQGLSMKKFPQSLNRLQSINSFVEETLEDAWEDVVLTIDQNIVISIVHLLQLHECVATRLIARVLQQVSHKPYSAPYEKTLDLFQQLQENRFKKHSAGGCVISQKKAQLIFVRDERLKNAAA